MRMRVQQIIHELVHVGGAVRYALEHFLLLVGAERFAFAQQYLRAYPDR